jgi:selenocysteine-specific elongation factor
LAGTEALGEAQVRGVLTRAAQRGEVFPVVRDLYYHPNAIRDLAAIARRVQAQDGAVRAAAFRDQTGLGRKRAIQLLEYFDQIGLLRRLHDRHLLRPDHPLAAAAMDNRGAAAAAGAAAQNPPSRDSAQDLR